MVAPWGNHAAKRPSSEPTEVGSRKEQDMKKFIVRAIALGLAFVVSLGVLAVVSGPAVALTTKPYKVTPAFVIHTSAFTYRVACPNRTLTGGPISATYPWWTVTGYSSTCTYTTSGTPALAGAKFVIGPLYLYINSARNLVVTDAQFVLTYGSAGACTVTMTNTLVLPTTDGIHLTFGEKTVATAGHVTVSPTTGVCATVTSALAASGSKLTITLNFTEVLPT